MIARMKETRNIQLSEFSTVQLPRLPGREEGEICRNDKPATRRGVAWGERFFRRRDDAVTLLPLSFNGRSIVPSDATRAFFPNV